MTTRRLLAVACLGLALVLAACTAGSIDPADPTTAADATAAASTPAPTSSATASATATTGAVSANTATESELVAALEAAGVSSADRWAREILEYRPYDTTDPTLQHLQDELAKYDPDPATLAGILSVLTP
jgi:hypothetical protein